MTLNKLTGKTSGFSFQEKKGNEITRLSEMENYAPKKTRMTEDGRMCAKVFVSQSKTYFDCTKSKSPDGEIGEKEWCYVDPIYKIGREWAYCIPILDYDRVRKTNFEALKELIKLVSKIILEIGQNLGPAQNSLDDIHKVKKMQDGMQDRMNNLIGKMGKVTDNLSKLDKAKDNCILQEKNVQDLLFIIDRKERELKSQLQKEESSNSVFMKNNNCRGMLLYEDEEPGDGLIGYYYDNENWLGHYKERKAAEINFDWTDGVPIDGINPNNFSVIWEGFLIIPVTDSYTFSIECDDGAELYLNDELVLSHNTKNIIDNYKNLLKTQPDEESTTKLNIFKSSSAPVDLNGSIKIKIKLKYFHSVHTSIYTGGQVYIRLFWMNSDFPERMISTQYYFTSYFYDPIKITEYNMKELELRRLHENDNAFIGSDRYILQDIPKEFINFGTLKLKSRFMGDELSFRTNTPINVFVGIISHYPNPLSNDFENSGMSMSLLQLDKNQVKGSKKLTAKKSAKLVIYKKPFNRGDVKIRLNKTGINSKGVPLVIFFGFDNYYKSPLLCSGKEMLISKTSGQFFSKCSSSSKMSGFQCEDAFSGKMRDEEGGMWASDSDGIGGWISVEFNNIYRISRVQYRNRKNPSERNSKIEMKFSSGDTRDILLKNNDEIIDLSLDNVRANSVKFTIKDVYGTLNNGGAFNIYGLKCWYVRTEEDADEDSSSSITPIESEESNTNEEKNRKIEPLFKKQHNIPIEVNCYDSLSNSVKFEAFSIQFGKKYIINCPESCSTSMTYIYGTDYYTKDSAICKAAFHAKKITSLGGLVTMIINKSKNNFKGSHSNGIKSDGKGFSSVALSFETYQEEDLIILKPGSKIDLKMENMVNGFTWSKAILTNIIDSPNGKFVKLILDGENSNPISLPYPNKEKIAACGEKINNRNCDGSVRKEKSNPILIRFVPFDYQSEITVENKGFLYDTGNIFGLNGKPYGWSVDMNNKLFKRINFSKPYLETLAEFPPPSNSKSCTKSRPENLCEPVVWKVKAGKGKFLVKFFVGDPKEDFTINLKANDKYIFKNKMISKNKEEVMEEVIETKNEIIELSSDCEEECDYSKTKINAIQISPIDFEEDHNETEKIEKASNCGNSFTGGRCNTGPNVIHCLFDSIFISSANFCSVNNALVNIPQNYKCKEHIGQYKCVQKEYSDPTECKMFCPKDCQESKCIY
jgi:hypothetical protein